MRKTKYDLIAVLGYAFTDQGQLPSHVTDRLKIVASLHQAQLSTHIALCGKWTLRYHLQNEQPPSTEAEEMKKILVGYGVPQANILKEEYSMDTIGNGYYLKNDIVKKNKYKKILIVCADFHLSRVQYIFTKIFGQEYKLDFLGTHTELIYDEEWMNTQKNVLEKQKEFLAKMQAADEDSWRDTLYEDPFYTS